MLHLFLTQNRVKRGGSVGNIVIVTQRAPPFVFVLDATAIIIMEVMIDILSLKDFTLILRFVISCYISRN